MTKTSAGAQAQQQRNHPPARPQAPDQVPSALLKHSSAQRTDTDVIIVDAIRKEYSQLHLTVVPSIRCDILAYASAGHAGIAPIDTEKEHLSWRQYLAPSSRLSGRGVLVDDVKYGKYLLDWKNKEFVIYVIDGRDGNYPFGVQRNQYVLSSSVQATNELLLEAGQYGNLLHDEVWVFDQGYWQKSADLWESVQKARWEDVILKPEMKKLIKDDVLSFFDSRETYEKLRVPWKRGIIYFGPPGNGKTISVKALMNTLYKREDPVPTLYVRTLSSFAGPEYSLGQIFAKARATAPCLLVFEDLDSIVTDQVRSYFLNEVDGIKKNDGILIIGSTNHLERLDPGIVKRPSRFDRKYEFRNPDEGERVMYLKYWQGKLSDNHDLDFPDKLCPAVARITKGFSFAYLQEAIVAALLTIARDDDTFSGRTCLECMQSHAAPQNSSSCDRQSVRPFKGLYDYVWLAKQVEDGDSSLDNYVLWREIKKQVRILREEMGDEDSVAR
ncbi:hypothetical protein DOTSEDRAFT_67831 [Dothistroma septosporum NZE10]|uniref:AAA+ ATPase domain-containing protein n=1 Tax=Dothistroma septosporum (strain NZE10 / CBS 128990) TaxID=675120 RepID=N1Q0U3_DOTSN|nr:hypothetical protein DOTSEDRAFT_67831 [Dothistroma septosporum NZE10]